MNKLKNTDLCVRSYWLVESNVDLTEGRGRRLNLAFCELEETAKRVGRGKYVMGSNCPVRKIDLFFNKKTNEVYGPISLATATEEDKRLQKISYDRDQVIKKAKSLGLTNDEISML